MDLPQTGELFEGRYRVERELGVGGFAHVFLVTDQSSRRQAALKVLIPEEDGGYSADTRARFKREVQSIAGLQHPNTVTLYDCGESAGGVLFMVFEYVPGEDLVDLLSRVGRLESDTVRQILVQILGALHEAHSAGLVHRDIKPSNIRVCSPPGAPIEVRLLDFGIARSTRSGATLTQPGQLIGTPRYMSPEQLMEKPLRPASDIYSLGMVAFELLVGSEALPGNRWADQFDRLRTGHVFSAELSATFDHELLELIQRMAARDPRARPASALAVLTALGEPVTAPLAAKPEAQSADDTSSNRGLIVALIVAGLAVLIAAAAIMKRPDPPPPTPVVVQRAIPVDLIKEPDLGAAAGISASPSPDMEQDATRILGPGESAGCYVSQPNLPAELKIFQPAIHDRKARPLIIWLHSKNQVNPAQAPESPTFQRLIDEEQVIVAVPKAPPGVFGPLWDPDHLGVLAAVRDALLEQLCVDPRRVYVWAAAGGGDLASLIACEPWVAGVAIAAYVEDASTEFPCDHPRPIWWSAARDSAHQPIRGGQDCGPISALATTRRSFATTLERLSKERGCGKADVSYSRPNAKCKRWRCEIPLETCEVDGGLGWHGAPQPFMARKLREYCDEPPPDPKFDAAAQAWKFFESFSPK